MLGTELPSVLDFFCKDFPNHNGVAIRWKCLDVQILASIGHDRISGACFLSFYIPHTKALLDTACALMWEIAEILKVLKGGLAEQGIDLSITTLTRYVYLYTEDEFPSVEVDELKHLLSSTKLFLQVRDPAFLRQRWYDGPAVAFISHDWRDKKDIARPLAMELQKKYQIKVWYDEFTMRVGFSLRESIESGLKNCRYCIVILSNHFLANEGWALREFSSAYTTELVKRRRLLLPVWVNVTPDMIYEYSPIMADRLGVSWDTGLENVALELARSIGVANGLRLDLSKEE